MKLYIAGKITGDENYIKKFDEAEKVIEKELHAEAINPACLRLPKSCTWGDYMRITLEMLSLADGIVLLPDWKESPGACMECGYALASDKRIIHYKGIKKRDEEVKDELSKTAAPPLKKRQ